MDGWFEGRGVLSEAEVARANRNAGKKAAFYPSPAPPPPAPGQRVIRHLPYGSVYVTKVNHINQSTQS